MIKLGYKVSGCFLLFLVLTHFVVAQNGDFFIGVVKDSTSNEAIPFATLLVKDQNMGVITNADGTFKIPTFFKNSGEALLISSMGYTSKEVILSTLNENTTNVIFLNAGPVELNEAIVSAKIKKLSAHQIVKIAVNSIPQNYPLEPFGLVGYYRDYQIKNGEYSNLNEALIQVYDDGFGKKDNFNNNYRLLSYKQNLEFKIDSFAMQPYDYKQKNKVVPGAIMHSGGGNEFILLSIHDAIRNYGKESFSFIDNLATDFIQKHTFRLKKTTVYNNQEVYEIDLVYRNNTYVAYGSIFINKDDFAIHKLDYSLFKRKKPGQQSIAVNEEERYSDGFSKTGNELVYHIITEYSRGDNKQLYLNYISFYNKMLIKRPAEFKSRFTIDLSDNSFKIKLNKTPARLGKIKNEDFKISYRDKQIPILEFYYVDNTRTFVVCPHFTYHHMEQAFKELFAESKGGIAFLKYEYGKIHDDLGNNLDEQKLEFMHQYREFFTQQVTPEKELIIEDSSSFMIKTAPLDNPSQPVFEGEMKNEYWMNTPLPGLEP